LNVLLNAKNKDKNCELNVGM